jgi:hypothetical protein
MRQPRGTAIGPAFVLWGAGVPVFTDEVAALPWPSGVPRIAIRRLHAAAGRGQSEPIPRARAFRSSGFRGDALASPRWRKAFIILRTFRLRLLLASDKTEQRRTRQFGGGLRVRRLLVAICWNRLHMFSPASGVPERVPERRRQTNSANRYR